MPAPLTIFYENPPLTGDYFQRSKGNTTGLNAAFARILLSASLVPDNKSAISDTIGTAVTIGATGKKPMTVIANPPVFRYRR